MPVGRNDSCPCGSGKKFKKCCAVVHAPATASRHAPYMARADGLKLADRKLVERLIRFASKRFGKPWFDEALDEYVGQEESLDEDELQLAIPWVLFHYPTNDAGLSVAQTMSDDRATRLPLELREVLDAQLQSWLSVWDVREVEPGVGIALKDLLTGEQRFVHEVSASRSLIARHTVMGRVVDCDGVAFLGGLHPAALPPMAADPVVGSMRRVCRVRTRPVSRDKLRDVSNQLALIDMWRLALGEASRPQPAPILTNTDDDMLVPTADHFEITPGKAPEIVRLMATFDRAEAEPPEGGESVFVVTRPGNARMKSWDNTIIGRVVVRGSRMIVESNSAQRADDLRGRLEVHLRGLVKHRLRDESSVEAMLEQAREAAARGIVTQPPDVPPELRAMARQVKEAHMRDWVNEQIPALGGLTPREAARAPRSRADLELLLRDFEFREAQLPAEERFDMRQLRATLGLKE